MRVEFERLLRIGLVVLWMLVSWLASSPILRAQPVSLPQPELITDRQGLPQAFVPSILQDRQGFIWAATRDGLCRYDGRQFKVFQPDPDGRPSLSFAGLEQLVLDHQAYIWIVSERGDLDRFNPRTETFTNFSRQPAFRRMLTGNTSFRLCIDRQDRLWIMPKGNGVLCYNLKTNQGKWFRHQAAQTGSLSSDTVNDVAEGPDGVIWLATTNGLDRLDKPTQQFTHFQNQPTSLQSLPDNHIDGLHIRPTGEIMMLSRQHLSLLQPHTGKIRSYLLPDQGNQWQDTHFAADRKGTIYFDQNSILFRFTDQQGPTVAARWNQPTDDCASLFIDQTDVLWVGTNGAGIRTYDLRPNPFHTRRYTHQFHVDLLTSGVLGLAPIPPVAVSALKGLISYNFRSTFDTGDRLWFNVGSSDVYQLDPKTGKTDHYPLPVVFRSKLVSDTPCPMVTDPQGRVWAVYDSMAFWYDKQKGSWVRSEYSIPYEPASAITALVIDSQALWLASRAGGLWRVDRRTGRAKQFANHPDNPNSISSNSLYCLSADPTDSNHLWIGTFGNGLCLFDKRTEQFRRFNQSNGLPNNVVYSALPDRQGYLWIGTNKGLCRMNRRTFTTQIFTRDDGILADEFNSHHFLQFPDGTILMGGLEGFTVFDPRQIVGDRFEPPIELTGLQINNQVVVPDRPAAKGADTDRRSDERISPLGDLPTQATQQITLLYDQNYVTAQFAALQFNRPAKNRFRYRLEELETTWKQTDRPEAVYTNLPPGQYTLVLNATNTSGVWSRYVRRLGITIQPPIWATWWAYIVYVLAIAAAAFFLIRSSLNRLRLQQTVVLQEQKVEQLRLIDEMKARFLTNITHEFRTPLTLILTPAQRLSPTLHQPDQHRWLAAIERNAYQLLRLINQLMELAKLDAQALKVEESRGHLSTFIEELVQPFEESASAKGIQLIYQSDVLGDYWFDADKLEPIVTNLIANAIKFTPGRTGQNRPDATLEEGQINVSLRSQDGVILTVSDTGIGISAEELPYIFDRFYQAGQGSPSLRSSDESTTLILPNADPYKQGGTGIGLALVKELIQLQGGTIDVTSQPGHGTVFTVRIPYRPVIESILTPELKPLTDNTEPASADPLTTNEQPLILVVEDNPELAEYIAGSLPPTYRIHRAANGQEGYEQTLALQPDLVISDVLMPVLDGYEFCQFLKSDVRINHIPIILLTAKASVDSRLVGLNAGADDYLAKPFLVAELQLRVRNLLDRQGRLRERLRTELTTLPIHSVSDTSPSNPFLDDVYRLIDQHLDDSAFGAEELASAISMSRGHLYKKIKALTDLTVHDVIRNYRLKCAAQLLRAGNPVAQTGYMVGFESPSYFTKCFRELYGLPPSDYVGRLS